MKLTRGLLLLTLLLPGCSMPYLVRQLAGGVRLLARARPVEAALTDPQGISADIRLALSESQRALAFAEEQGLDVGNSYRTFVDLGEKPPVYVLFACPPDRLEPVVWTFPFVGRAPYKGFFDLDAAVREARQLQADGFETHLGAAAAYSLLGWWPDPVFSSMLVEEPGWRVDTLFHELAHRTLFVSGQTEFNESLANFVGGVLAERFLIREYGPESEELRAYQDRRHDRQLFGSVVRDTFAALEKAFANPDRGERLAAREQVFTDASLRIASGPFRTDRYDAILSEGWSLPLMISIRLYESHPELFRALLDRSDGEFGRFFAVLEELDLDEKPFERLEEWVGGT